MGKVNFTFEKQENIKTTLCISQAELHSITPDSLTHPNVAQVDGICSQYTLLFCPPLLPPHSSTPLQLPHRLQSFRELPPAWVLHSPQLLSRKSCFSMDSALAAFFLVSRHAFSTHCKGKMQPDAWSTSCFSAVSHSFLFPPPPLSI